MENQKSNIKIQLGVVVSIIIILLTIGYLTLKSPEYKGIFYKNNINENKQNIDGKINIKEKNVKEEITQFEKAYIKVYNNIINEQQNNKNSEIQKYIYTELKKSLKNNEINLSDIKIEKQSNGKIENDIFWNLFVKYYQIDPS